MAGRGECASRRSGVLKWAGWAEPGEVALVNDRLETAEVSTRVADLAEAGEPAALAVVSGRTPSHLAHRMEAIHAR